MSAAEDDDTVDERTDFKLTATGGDYEGKEETVRIAVADNDRYLVVKPDSLTVAEGGSGNFTVALSSAPSAEVTVTLRQGDTSSSDVTFDTDPTTDGDQSALTFTTSNWNEARTVTVSAAEDADALADRETIELIASGGDYAGKSESVSVSVSENDAAGLTVSPTDLTVSEGGSETFKVSLATQPSASVTVTLAQPSDTDVRVDTDPVASGNQVTLSFTTENWNEARTVSVSAAEDDDTVDERTDFKLTATGGDYEGKEETVRIAVADNDRYLVVKPDSLTVAEGGSGNFTVALSSAPSAEVTVTLRRGGTSSSDVTFDTDPTTDGDQSALTFTTSNWNEARTVTVSAAEDADALADRETIELNASGGDYAGKSESVSVSVSENDTAGLTVSPTDLTVSEGGSETFKVSLATQPSASVTVTLAQPSDTDVRVDTDSATSGDQTTLSFTTENWNEARTVQVSAAEDDDTVDESMDFKLTATGGDYEGKEETVRIAVADNDRYLVVKPDSLTVAEGGSGNFTVALSSAPSAEVTVTLRRGGTTDSDVTFDTDPTTDGDQSTLTFDSSNWRTARTVTVSAAEDADALADRATIELSASGGDYAGKSESVSVSVSENDAAGLSVSPTDLTVDEGGNNTFTVALTSAPSAEVTVTLRQATDNSDVTFDTDPTADGNQSTLSFTAGSDDDDGNWRTGQTVTVSAAQDADAADESASISLIASGGDYAGKSESVSVSVSDDETLALVVSESSLTVAEGSTKTFDVKLSHDPVSDVSVSLTKTNTDAVVTLSRTSLTFTGGAGGNWSRGQTVTVSGVDDADAANETDTVTVKATNVAGVADKTVAVAVTDNERLALVVTPDGDLAVGEGSTGTVTVKLSHDPGAGVSVSVSLSKENDDITLSRASLTFAGGTGDEGNWSTAQSVTVMVGQDDDAANDSGSVTVSATATGFTDIADKTVSVAVADDDRADLTLSKNSVVVTGVSVSEESTATFDVRLATQPSGSVTVTIARPSNADVTVDTDTTTQGDQTTLTFGVSGSGVGSWKTDQTVTVSASADDDAVDDRATLTLSASGGGYDGISKELAVSVSDNDTAALMLSVPSLSVDEGGSKTFTVRLATEPSATVTVTLRRGGTTDSDVTFDTDPTTDGNQSTLTFTTSNWNEARTVTVSAAEDADALADRATIELNASGGDYAGKSERVSVSVSENDTAGLTVSPTDLTVSEGGSETFKVSLATQPSASVTVTLAQPSDTDVRVDTDPVASGNQVTLSFTTENWNEARTVSVSAAEDDDTVDERTDFKLTATGGDYEGKEETVRIAVADNDRYLVVKPDSLTVAEGGSGNFTVALSSAPSAEVTVTLRRGGTSSSDVTFDTDPTTDGDQSALTFTTSNWNEARTVTVSAAEDADALADRATIELSASGGDYAGKSESVSVSVSENDAAALTVSPTDLTVSEGGSETFKVSLATQPSASVTVTLAQPSDTDVRVDTDPVASGNQVTLSFTTENWNEARTVSVSAAEDDDTVDERTDFKLTATGGDYEGKEETVRIAVADNDRYLVVKPDSLTVAEGGSGNFTVALSSAPSAEVTVTLRRGGTSSSDVTFDTDPTTDGDQSALTFTTSNWNEARTVTVSAAEDADALADRATIELSAAGGDYAGKSESVSVSVSENDAAGLTVSPTDLTVSEGGSETFEVSLATQPSASVTVTLAQPSDTDVRVDTDSATSGDQTTLSFTTENWNEARTVQVSAAEDDDTVDERTDFKLTATGGDYEGKEETVRIAVADNDRYLVVKPDSLTVAEGGSGNFTVALSSAPSAEVTVTLRRGGTTDSDVTFDTDPTTDGDQSALTFTTSNWNEARTVTVSAAEDADALADRETIELNASGGDYAGKSESVSVSVSENDTAGLTVSPTDLTVSEGGSETFKVSLATQPSASVTVTLAQPSDTDVRVDTDSATSGDQTKLSFTTENWNEARTVSVSAAEDDDTVDERTDFKLTATGGDYEGKEETVRIAVADNDRYLVVKPDSLTVAEGGSGNFTVALSSAPSAEVTVTLRRGDTSSSDVTFDTDPTTDGDQSALTFTTSNWNEARTVTVSAAEDADALADRETIELIASGGDYAGKSESVSVSVSENDAAGLTVSPTDLTVSEGGSETFKVSLATQPSASVTVTLAQPSDTDVRVDTDPVASGNQVTLSFTTENWNEARTVSVSAAEDDDTVDERTDFKLTATGGDYEGKEETVRIAVADNDRYLVVKPDSLTVAEGGSGNFTVALSSAPSAEVTVTLRRGGTSSSDVTFDTDPTTDGDQSALTFTTSNWNEARTVTVSAAEDADALADRETIELSASGGDYAGKSESVSVSVSENDTAGLTVSPTDLTVSEGGSETFKVSLATQPSASVTVTLAQPSDTDVRVDTDPVASGNQVTLSFTTENWNEARTVSVSAAEDDDTVDERTDFKLTATGGDYEGKEETVRIAVADNDRYLVVKPDSLTVAEGGSGNFTVALSSAPSAEVTVTLRRGGTSSSDVTFDTDPTTDGDQSALTFTTKLERGSDGDGERGGGRRCACGQGDDRVERVGRGLRGQERERVGVGFGERRGGIDGVADGFDGLRRGERNLQGVVGDAALGVGDGHAGSAERYRCAGGYRPRRIRQPSHAELHDGELERGSDGKRERGRG